MSNFLPVSVALATIAGASYIGANEITHMGDNHDGSLKVEVEQKVVDRHMVDGMGVITLQGCGIAKVKLNDPLLNMISGKKQDRCPTETFHVSPDVYSEHRMNEEIKPEDLS